LLPSVFGIWALQADIENIILGEAFIRTEGLLPLIALGVFFFGLSQYYNKPFELKEKTKYIFYVLSIAALLNIILNIFFIPAFGVIGAAYTTLISYAFYLFFLLLLSSRFFPLKFNSLLLLKVTGSSFMMFFSLRLINIYLPTGDIFYFIFKVLVGIIVYFTTLYLLKEKRVRDIINK
ncbi:MAG: polysaccharide biosynthesis C-terminal domain-containing protein, partial [bacterium]